VAIGITHKRKGTYMSPLPDGQIGVSNTEVQQAYRCEFAWSVGFHPDLNYQLRDFGVARTRGIIGHKALETFYQGLKETEDYDKSAEEALTYIQNLRVEEIKLGDFKNPERVSMLNYLYDVLNRYFEHYQDDIEDWEILDIEGFYAQEQPDESDFYLPSRIDLVIYQRGGRFKGETSPVDHKFVYDFWNPWKLRLNSQLPLYIRALRAARFAGKPEPVVKRGIVNQIRTRFDNPSERSVYELFDRKFQDYTSKNIESAFDNHMKSAVRLAYLKRLPIEEVMTEIQASLGSDACQFCDFKDYCLATIEGKDPSNVVMATMKKNEYGYPTLEEIRRERN
jgi:hypothetical protein